MRDTCRARLTRRVEHLFGASLSVIAVGSGQIGSVYLDSPDRPSGRALR
jgi:hypothetical protein